MNYEAVNKGVYRVVNAIKSYQKGILIVNVSF